MTPDELYEEADALEAEANKMLDSLQDYISDVEHEVNDMYSEARKLREEAGEMEAVDE